MAARPDRTTSRTDPAHGSPTPAADPPVIPANAVYSLAQAARALGLRKNCLPREARLRRLRVAKRAGRYFVLGAWLLDWLAAGEVGSTRAPANTERRVVGDGSAA